METSNEPRPTTSGREATKIKPEIEATFLDIDKVDFRRKLKAAGAELIQAELLMKRTIFSINKHAYARVRDEGNRITMTYKTVDQITLSGTKEVCLAVNSYDDAVLLLQSCGLKIKAQQETLREEWLLDGVEITIDTWPWLPTYTEIEGPSEASVKSVTGKLGLDMQNALYGCVDRVYRVYYDVISDDINYCPEIKFTPIPAWLKTKKRTTPLTPAEYND